MKNFKVACGENRGLEQPWSGRGSYLSVSGTQIDAEDGNKGADHLPPHGATVLVARISEEAPIVTMEKLKAVVAQVITRLPAVRGRGEEATKQALVLPMIDALGYDIWNPAEVCPEFEADFATKKLGQKEKVDIAISLSGVPRIYFEVKSVDTTLDGHEGQLARYFNATTSVSLAILTNGVEYRFFTDTGDPNVMDAKPFHVANLEAIDQGLDVFARFNKAVFSPDAIREYATELNYTARMVAFLRDELDLRDREPSERFVRSILSQEGMYPGRITASVVERFSPIAKNALQIVLRDIVRRSVAALDKEVTSAPATTTAPDASPAQPQAPTTSRPEAPEAEAPESKDLERSKIVTTERELEAFAVVKALFDSSLFAKAMIWDASVRKDVPIVLSYKDTTGYFVVYFNKPSNWILRLSIDGRIPWIGFNLPVDQGTALLPPGCQKLEASPYAEFRVAVTGPRDLDSLNRLVFASFKAVIDERERMKHSAEPGSLEPESA